MPAVCRSERSITLPVRNVLTQPDSTTFTLSSSAFAPSAREVDTAAALIERAMAADWAPVQFEGRLHDRASYRYYWQVLERAHHTGLPLPEAMQPFFNEPATAQQ